jgi:hypothetical protein
MGKVEMLLYGNSMSHSILAATIEPLFAVHERAGLRPREMHAT